MKKISHIILVDNNKHPLKDNGVYKIVLAQDYITGNLPEELLHTRHLKVINLCANYDYLRTGYYCSLLAEAREHKCIPDISHIAHAKWKRVYKDSLEEVDEQLKTLSQKPEFAAIEETLFFFGRTPNPALEKLGRKLFDIFRLPIMQVVFTRKKNILKITDVEPIKLSALQDHTAFFEEALRQYIGTYWYSKTKNQERCYWLAILHAPEEPHPPSNQKALDKFIKIGKKKRFFVELITRQNYENLLEYDALFIRATTNVNHYTYRFAQKASREDMVCVDDTDSILRCCNKIYLHELLDKKRIATPKTAFISAQQEESFVRDAKDFPLVLKLPDAAFSSGVFKVENTIQLSQKLSELFKHSELVVAQEFLFSEYDWRIGVLDGKPLFACKYYMAKQHWQIYNHASTKNKEGDAESIPLSDVPPKVISTAIKAASLIGKGLYGVDIKEIKGKPYVIEINDNPNIDAGFEDAVEGDAIYEAIFDYFEREINA